MKGVKSAEAVIDNGEYGVRKIRFETGRLARQASGSALAILDDETVVENDERGTRCLPGEPARLEPDFAYAKFTVVNNGFGAFHTLHG